MNKIERIGGHLMKMANLLSSCCSSCVVVVVGLSGGHVFILTNWQADREGEDEEEKENAESEKDALQTIRGVICSIDGQPMIQLKGAPSESEREGECCLINCISFHCSC